jgi:iron(II)-dependent oxidoreductase
MSDCRKRNLGITRGGAAVAVLCVIVLLLPVAVFPSGDEARPVRHGDGSLLLYVPESDFWMGNDQGAGDPDERPLHYVHVKAFYIGKHEIINRQFEAFVNATGYKVKGGWKPLYGCDGLAAANLTWFDADAYCRHWGLRLPAEAEWERAARGTDARFYPWGNDWYLDICNWDDGGVHDGFDGPAPPGAFHEGESPCGAVDMAGNLWEWCADWYGPYSGNPLSRTDFGEKCRVLRGGSFRCNNLYDFSCSNRLGYKPSYWLEHAGFRPAKDAPWISRER